MTQEAPAFFTLDRGTVATTAGLVAPVEGRYRLLAAARAPVGLDPDSVLEDLAWRVARTDATLAGSMEGWRSWSRLEVSTARPPRAVLVAASERTGALLERAFLASGWIVQDTFFGPQSPFIALGQACLDPALDAVIMGGRDGMEDEERTAAHQLWSRLGSLARFRDDLAVAASGPFAERPEGIPDDRLYALPSPDDAPATVDSSLRTAAGQLGRYLVERGQPVTTDSRTGLRAAIASLAQVLGAGVDGLEVGVAAGSRTQARPAGEQAHAVFAEGGLFPQALLSDDAFGEATLRWSTLGGDPSARLDSLRQVALHPWGDLEQEGQHLQLAALRGALERLEAAWHAGPAAPLEARSAGVTVLSGGAFAALPPAASAIALLDGVRRPGAMSVLFDHAGLLAPLGALPVEADRQRLLGDLLGDVLLPLGSAIVTGAIGAPRKDGRPASLTVASVLGEERLALEAGGLQLVDLPPGVSGRLGLDPGGGSVLGVEGRTVSMEVNGGLAGLFVDTRPIPLDLPPAGEARRSTLAAWEGMAWSGSER